MSKPEASRKPKIPAPAQGFLFAQKFYRTNTAAGLDEFSLYGKVAKEGVGAV